MDFVGYALSIITAIAVIGGFILNIYSNRRAARTEQTHVYFEIGQKWSEVLRILYIVRNDPPPSLAELESTYTTCQEFMETELWKEKYRTICNFFEDIGLIVYNKNLKLETVRVLITVSEDDYRMMKPVLDYVRQNYRADIYSFWNYLLYCSVKTKALQPFKNGKMYEPR